MPYYTYIGSYPLELQGYLISIAYWHFFSIFYPSKIGLLGCGPVWHVGRKNGNSLSSFHGCVPLMSFLGVSLVLTMLKDILIFGRFLDGGRGRGGLVTNHRDLKSIITNQRLPDASLTITENATENSKIKSHRQIILQNHRSQRFLFSRHRSQTNDEPYSLPFIAISPKWVFKDTFVRYILIIFGGFVDKAKGMLPARTTTFASYSYFCLFVCYTSLSFSFMGVLRQNLVCFIAPMPFKNSKKTICWDVGLDG